MPTPLSLTVIVPAENFSDPYRQVKDGQWIQFENCKARFVTGYSMQERETELGIMSR